MNVSCEQTAGKRFGGSAPNGLKKSTEAGIYSFKSRDAAAPPAHMISWRAKRRMMDQLRQSANFSDEKTR
jgi:hypothetical protein